MGFNYWIELKKENDLLKIPSSHPSFHAVFTRAPRQSVSHVCHGTKSHTAGRERLLLVSIRVPSSPTSPPQKVPHLSEMGGSWGEEQDGSRGRTHLHHSK